MEKTFKGKIFTAYDHAPDQRAAYTRAKTYQEQGLQIRVTKDPEGGWLIWKRGERKPEVEKELQERYERLKKRGLLS